MLPPYIGKSKIGLVDTGGLCSFYRFCSVSIIDEEILIMVGRKSQNWSGKWEMSMGWSECSIISANQNPWKNR